MNFAALDLNGHVVQGSDPGEFFGHVLYIEDDIIAHEILLHAKIFLTTESTKPGPYSKAGAG